MLKAYHRRLLTPFQHCLGHYDDEAELDARVAEMSRHLNSRNDEYQ